MAHINEKLDFTVGVLIVCKNKVLLRKHDKYKIWLGPGGHIEPGEDPIQAVIREAKEEVGLDIAIVNTGQQSPVSNSYQVLIPPAFMDRHRINDVHEHVDLVYIATSQSDTLKLSQDEKSDEVKWFTKEDLDRNLDGIGELILFYAKNALNVVT